MIRWVVKKKMNWADMGLTTGVVVFKDDGIMKRLDYKTDVMKMKKEYRKSSFNNGFGSFEIYLECLEFGKYY